MLFAGPLGRAPGLRRVTSIPAIRQGQWEAPLLALAPLLNLVRGPVWLSGLKPEPVRVDGTRGSGIPAGRPLLYVPVAFVGGLQLHVSKYGSAYMYTRGHFYWRTGSELTVPATAA